MTLRTLANARGPDEPLPSQVSRCSPGIITDGEKRLVLCIMHRDGRFAGWDGHRLIPLDQEEAYNLADTGAQIRHLRCKRMLTQRQLAQLIGVTRTTVNQWENNVKTPYSTREQQLQETIGYRKKETK